MFLNNLLWRVIRHLLRIETTLDRMEKTMSELRNKLNALAAKVTDLESGEEAVGQALHDEIGRAEARITTLEAEIEAGVATPEDLAMIDTLSQRVDALKAQAGIMKDEADAAPADPNPADAPAPAAEVPPAPAPEVPPTA